MGTRLESPFPSCPHAVPTSGFLYFRVPYTSGFLLHPGFLYIRVPFTSGFPTKPHMVIRAVPDFACLAAPTTLYVGLLSNYILLMGMAELIPWLVRSPTLYSCCSATNRPFTSIC